MVAEAFGDVFRFAEWGGMIGRQRFREDLLVFDGSESRMGFDFGARLFTVWNLRTRGFSEAILGLFGAKDDLFPPNRTLSGF